MAKIKKVVRNSKGEEIKLTDMEQRIANARAVAIKNEAGVDVDTTTLTKILKRTVGPKYFTIKPSDFVPVRVGEGGWANKLKQFTVTENGGSFAEGITNLGRDNSEKPSADVGIDSFDRSVFGWAKQINWNIFELKEAMEAGQWDLITARANSRKRNWDLGIQKVAFLGLEAAKGECRGLYNQKGVKKDTTLITKKISEMTATEFNTMVASILDIYRKNSNYTAQPTHFVIPEDDFNGLVSATSADFPLKTKLEYLKAALKEATGNPNFEVRGNAYGIKANNAKVINVDRYALYNYDEDSIRMDIPVDFNVTLANTVQGFDFQNVGYGRFTGVDGARKQEMIYFDR